MSIKIQYDSIPPMSVNGFRAGDEITYTINSVAVPWPSETFERNRSEVIYTYIRNAGDLAGGVVEILTNPTSSPVTYSVEPGLILDPVTNVFCMDVSYTINEASKARLIQDALLCSSTYISVIVSLGTVTYSVEDVKFPEGSLGKHTTDQFTAMLAGLTPDDVTVHELFSSYNFDPNTPAAELNPTRFYKDIDLSGASFIWETDTDVWQHRGASHLISPRHAVGADHYIPAIGNRAMWRRRDGTFQTVTVLDKVSLPNSRGQLAYLSEPVVNTSNFKIMPNGWREKYAPSVSFVEDANAMYAFPGLFQGKHKLDQTGSSQTYVVLQGCSRGKLSLGYIGRLGLCPQDILTPWSIGEYVGGDSSSGLYLIVNGEPMIHGAASTAPSYNYYDDDISSINTSMNEMALAAGDPLAGTYVVSHPDLSAFNDYSGSTP